MEAWLERCAISRQDLSDLRQGTQAVVSMHIHIMRILKFSKRKPGRKYTISNHAKKEKNRHYLLIVVTFILSTWFYFGSRNNATEDEV